MKLISLLLFCCIVTGCGQNIVMFPRPKDGVNGAQGPAGVAGSNGHSVAVTQTTADGSLCSSGGTVLNLGLDTNDDTVLQLSEVNSVLVVCNGQSGAQGVTGPQGIAGTNATPVTVVQLCSPSFVPSYPSTFPEVAFCINNKLYGVYSANGGFMTYLPPGTYSSNGINASCTVTIQENCVLE